MWCVGVKPPSSTVESTEHLRYLGKLLRDAQARIKRAKSFKKKWKVRRESWTRDLCVCEILQYYFPFKLCAQLYSMKTKIILEEGTQSSKASPKHAPPHTHYKWARSPGDGYFTIVTLHLISGITASVEGCYNSRCLPSHTSINLQIHSGCEIMRHWKPSSLAGGRAGCSIRCGRVGAALSFQVLWGTSEELLRCP